LITSKPERVLRRYKDLSVVLTPSRLFMSGSKYVVVCSQVINVVIASIPTLTNMSDQTETLYHEPDKTSSNQCDAFLDIDKVD